MTSFVGLMSSVYIMNFAHSCLGRR